MSKFKYKTNLIYLLIITYIILGGIYIFDKSNPLLLFKIFIVMSFFWILNHFITRFFKNITITGGYIIINNIKILVEQIKKVEIKKVYIYDGNKGKLFEDGLAIPNTLCFYITINDGKKSKTITLLPKQYEDEKRLKEKTIKFCSLNSIPIIGTEWGDNDC